MKVRIHRGAEEIGGSCVELEAAGHRLVLDLGLPLGVLGDAPAPLPGIDGLADGDDPSLLGVVISHIHPDHYGLIEAVHPGVAIYAGKAAERIADEAAFFSAGVALPPLAGHLVDRTPVELGPFRLKPYLVDHSAFDAYALLVEAGGQRLFYSGDLRAHGRKAGTFQRLLADPPREIDALLLEGTRLNRGPSMGPASETEVETQAAKLMGDAKGLVLALYSPQNIDRLVSLYRAARRAGRELVLDLYAEAVAAATGNESVPQASWKSVRVYVPQAQRVRVKRAGAFERVDGLGANRVYLDELSADPGRFVFTFRASMASELEREPVLLEGAEAIWSMWPGYLTDHTDGLHRYLKRNSIEMTSIHASGHATPEDLQKLAGAIGAKRVVPIHTEVPEVYDSLFENVERHADGEWWDL